MSSVSLSVTTPEKTSAQTAIPPKMETKALLSSRGSPWTRSMLRIPKMPRETPATSDPVLLPPAAPLKSPNSVAAHLASTAQQARTVYYTYICTDYIQLDTLKLWLCGGNIKHEISFSDAYMRFQCQSLLAASNHRQKAQFISKIHHAINQFL